MERLSMEELERRMVNNSDKATWQVITQYQALPEDFINRHSDKLDWYWVCKYQALSEGFIERHIDKLDWWCISCWQVLSGSFMEKHSERINLELQRKKHHGNRTKDKKLKEMEEYAAAHSLEFNGGILVAYRKHDGHDRGSWNSTICYRELKHYRAWRCDLDPKSTNSFGLGIWPKGNVKVSVSVDDWGTAVDSLDGKARVYGFTLLEKNGNVSYNKLGGASC